MEETFIIEGIVISRQSFRERDSRIIVYAKEHGLMSLIARGTKNIKSKLAGHIEPANLIIAMVIRGRQFDYLGSTDSRQVFKNLKADFDKIMAFNLALKEFARTIKEGVVDMFLFNLLYDFIAVLDEKSKPKNSAEFFSSLFILKMISHLGYRPELYYCMDDREKIKPGNNCFSLEKGGLISGQFPGDEYHFKVSDDCIKMLRLIIKEDIKYLSKVKVIDSLEKEITRVIRKYYDYYVN